MIFSNRQQKLPIVFERRKKWLLIVMHEQARCKSQQAGI